MIARIRKSIDEKEKGFTLIELLVVIIIIGILSAIAIPLFLNQRKKAVDAAARADVSTIGKEVATWYVDHTATDPAVITSDGDKYMLAGEKISNQSANITLSGDTDTTSATEWKVVVDVADGTGTIASATYSAADGLQVIEIP